MSENLIKLNNVKKTYTCGDSDIYAVNNISLTINKGEFVAIVGSSGSGKSTLMNILGCLDFADEGEYFLDGHNINMLNDNGLSKIRNKEIGFIFQSYNLIQSLNALENVQLQLSYRFIPKTKRKALSINALKQVGLHDRMYHTPSQMSGGQQQRVAIARAIAASPPIILADEPTGNLDRKSSDEIIEILSELNKMGRTVLIITHDLKIAEKTNRIITICDGEIENDTFNLKNLIC